MRVAVKLYGALLMQYAGSHDHCEAGIEIPDGAKPHDLLKHLKIHDQAHVVITRNGRILRADDQLEDGDSVGIFQAVYGG